MKRDGYRVRLNEAVSQRRDWRVDEDAIRGGFAMTSEQLAQFRVDLRIGYELATEGAGHPARSEEEFEKIVALASRDTVAVLARRGHSTRRGIEVRVEDVLAWVSIVRGE